MEKSESDDPAKPEIAAKYQLVTPVSGAVVLETLEQFRQHGLEPIDADSAPSVPGLPEPSTWLMFLIGAMGALLRRSQPAGGELVVAQHRTSSSRVFRQRFCQSHFGKTRRQAARVRKREIHALAELGTHRVARIA